MCVIATIPANQKIPSFAEFKRAWDVNPDGAGFMYPDSGSGKLIVIKGLMSFTAFKNAFREHAPRFCRRVQQGQHPIAAVDICVHFRIKSHGALNAAMTHPHWVAEDSIAIAHNGIIRGVPNDPVKSDTVLFIDTILRKLPHRWWTSQAVVDLVKDRVGAGNKIVIFDEIGHVITIWEESGKWEQGIWWSNTHHLWSFPKDYNYDDSRKAKSCELQSTPWSEDNAPVQEPLRLPAVVTPPNSSIKTTSVGSNVRITKPPGEIVRARIDYKIHELVVEMRSKGEAITVSITLGQAQELLRQLKANTLQSQCTITTGKSFEQWIELLDKHIQQADTQKDVRHASDK